MTSDVTPRLVLHGKNQIHAAEGDGRDSKREENLMHYHWLEDTRGPVTRKWKPQSDDRKELNFVNCLK